MSEGLRFRPEEIVRPGYDVHDDDQQFWGKKAAEMRAALPKAFVELPNLGDQTERKDA